MKLNDLLKTSGNDSDLIFNDKHRAIKNYRLMQWAKLATFGLYIVAVFMLYVADVWGIGSFIEEKSNDWVALIVFSAIAFVLAFFLASSKEAVYEDIALHRAEGYKLKASQIVAMALFLVSGLLFEIFSTSNNQQHIANSAAENSAMFKSVESSGVNLSNGSATLTKDLQAAQMRLATCEQKLAQGKVKDCIQSNANLQAVRESMTMSNQLAQQTNAQAMNAKTDAMLKVREHFDKPMFKEIGKVAGTDNNGGMLIVIGVLIFVFECQHIMALFAYANALRRIKSNDSKPNTIQSQGNNGYGISPPLSPFDSAKMTVSEYAAKIEEGLKASPEIIATEYARAQHARNQTAEMVGDKLQALGNKVESAIKKPEATDSDNRPFYGFKDARKQSALDSLNLAHGSEDRKTLENRSANKPTPPTPPIQRQLISETIHELVGAVKKSGAKTEADIQTVVFDTYAKIFNPAELGDGDLMKIVAKIAKSTRPTPASETARSEQAETSPFPSQPSAPFPSQPSDAQPSQKPSELSIYEKWKSAVFLTSESGYYLRFSKAPTEEFIRANMDATEKAGRDITAIWNELLDKAFADGYLIKNPEYVEIGTNRRTPRYILSPTFKQAA